MFSRGLIVVAEDKVYEEIRHMCLPLKAEIEKNLEVLISLPFHPAPDSTPTQSS
jgi:hypothetical protein